MADLIFPGSQFVSGDWDNGFDLSFSLNDDGHTSADFTFADHHAGPPTVVHGGALATLLDEAMTAAVMQVAQGMAFTATLNLQYHAPVLVGTTIRITGEVVDVAGRKITARATISTADDRLLVSAEALFISMKRDM